MTVTAQPAKPGGFVARYLHTRRTRQETTMPETAVTTETTTTPTVLMQFRTQGGAIVEVVEEVRVRYWDTENPTARDTRYVYRCLGCDADDDSQYVFNARNEANKHAASCWSMPKPEAS